MTSGIFGGFSIPTMTIVEGKIVKAQNHPYDFTQLGEGKLKKIEGSEDVIVSGEYTLDIDLVKKPAGEYSNPNFTVSDGGLVTSINSTPYSLSDSAKVTVRDPAFSGSISFDYVAFDTDVFFHIYGEFNVTPTTPSKSYNFRLSKGLHPRLQPTVLTQLYTPQGEDIFNSPYDKRLIFVPITTANTIIESEMEIQFTPDNTIFSLRRGMSNFSSPEKILIDYTGLYSKEHNPVHIQNYPNKYW